MARDSSTDEALAAMQKVLGDALSYLMAENAKNSVQAVTFKRSLLDAIFELDTSNHSADLSFETMRSSDAGSAFSGGILPSLQKMGKLQKIQLLRLVLFGGQFKKEDGEVQDIMGAFDKLLDIPDKE
jgi:hypothetical protein